MRNDRDPDPGVTNLLPWAECDLFCIHDYAGTGGPPCGWRGTLQDARRPAQGDQLLGPRCGYATLLRIPAALTPPLPSDGRGREQNYSPGPKGA